MRNDKALRDLLDIMARLRDPDGGCPWDLEQDFSTIAPYTIEEAYEVADAIARGDMQDLKNELGDLLLQVVFHAQMAKENSFFDFDDVACAIADKMIRRHPHVFGDAPVRDTAAQLDAWEKQKADEREAAGSVSALDGVALGLPALMRAQKLLARAAKTGFEWKSTADILPKLDEEISEMKRALHAGDIQNLAEEYGDVLFVLVNMIRQSGLDAETVLRGANEKFIRRFQVMENLAQQQPGRVFSDLTLQEQESLWQESKNMLSTRHKPD